jgi:hypothetical protein
MDLTDPELLDYISESTTMSKAMDEYEGRKSCAITTAKRLAQFLGEGRVGEGGGATGLGEGKGDLEVSQGEGVGGVGEQGWGDTGAPIFALPVTPPPVTAPNPPGGRGLGSVTGCYRCTV